MGKASLTRIEKEIEKERQEVKAIEKDIDKLEAKLLDKVPDHFSIRDVIATFFGSLIIGITFILKGATLRTAAGLDKIHIISIIIFTISVLLLEIYKSPL